MMTEIKTPVDVQRVDGAMIVRFSQIHVDMTNCDEIFQTLFGLVQEEQPPLLVINLQRVSYFHSIAIGRLIELQRRVKSYGGELVLCRLNSQPIHILVLTRVDQQVNIIDFEPSEFPVNIEQLLAAAKQPLLPRRSLHLASSAP